MTEQAITQSYDPFYSLYMSASTASNNMASCIGVQCSIIERYEIIISNLLSDELIKETKYSTNALYVKQQLNRLKADAKAADYIFEHRTEGAIGYTEAIAAVEAALEK